MPDYPAAHSMDTTFYAVDAHGRVAVFESGENGPVPKGTRDTDIVVVARRLRGAPDPGPDEETDEEYGPAYEEVVARGVYIYTYIDAFGDEFVFPYTRTDVPARPAHLDELPPAVRQEFAGLRLPSADFTAAERLQLLEQVECHLWSEGSVAYYRSDGKEVKPVPGREAKYARALPGFRQQHPRLTFADVGGTRPKPAAKKAPAARKKAAPKAKPAAKKAAPKRKGPGKKKGKK